MTGRAARRRLAFVSRGVATCPMRGRSTCRRPSPLSAHRDSSAIRAHGPLGAVGIGHDRDVTMEPEPDPDHRPAALLRPRWLRGDLIAGVTVAALIVPKNLGYAGIAGIPLQNGLYAAAAGAILYAIFGTSRQISIGPSSGLAAVAASAVARRRHHRRSRTSPRSSPGSRSRRGCCSCSSPCSRWAGSRSSSRGPWSPASSSGRRSTSSSASCPSSPGPRSRAPTRSRSCGRGSARSARRTPATVVVGVVALVVVFGLRGVAPRVPGRPGAGRRRAARRRGCSTSAPRGGARRRRAPRAAVARASPTLQLMLGPRRHGRARGRRARADRVLADRRRRADVRRQAPLPDRHQPGVGRAGRSPTSAPGCSRGCRSRRACRRAR